MYLMSYLMLCWSLAIIACKAAKPPDGYTLTNTERSTENWASAAVRIPTKEISVCFWWKFSTLDAVSEQVMISVATAATDNHIVIMWNQDWDGILLRWQGVDLPAYGYTPPVEFWEYYCFVVIPQESHLFWTFQLHVGSDWPISNWNSHYGLNQFTVLFSQVPNPITGKIVDTSLVIFNEQDEELGGFNVKQAAVGSISCLNMWSVGYDMQQLYEYAHCRIPGDVYSMNPDTIELHGNVNGSSVATATTTSPSVAMVTMATTATTSPSVAMVTMATTTTTSPSVAMVTMATTTTTSPSEAMVTMVTTTTTTTSANRLNWSMFKILQNYQMPGLTKNLLELPTPLNCLQACVSRGCSHINYNQLNQTCEMGEGSEAMLKTAPGVTHYYLD